MEGMKSDKEGRKGKGGERAGKSGQGRKRGRLKQ